MALDRQPGTMDIGYPLFHFQDLKNGGVGGGFGTISAYSIQDITHIVLNEIAGATITTEDSGVVTSGVVGTHGKTNAPINSPTTTQLDKCYFTLPAGKYWFEISSATSTSSPSHGGLYNRTDSIMAQYFVSRQFLTSGASNIQIFKGKLNLSVNTDLDIRTILDTSATPSIGDKGTAVHTASFDKECYMDYKIYKIG